MDGKAVSAQMKREMAEEVAQIQAAGGKVPHLAAILVGHDGGSETYVAAKVKACAEIGFKSTLIRYEADVTEEELLRKVDELNHDNDIDGFIVQLPLPEHISETTIMSAIDRRKDVDGLTPENEGRTVQGLPSIISATPRGIRELLAYYQIPTEGRHVVVIGRSNIVGKPIAMLLMQRPYLSLPSMSAASLGDATVTICHSKTRDLKSICLTADIIIVAAGCPKLLTADMVKEGVTIIDVGINRVDGKLVGDVDFENIAPKAAYITPVPGGVGPMTIVSLLQNTLQAYELRIKN